MDVNDFCVNIINLKHRADRRHFATLQMQEQGITNYRFCKGIVHKLPFTGIAMAYKEIIQKAKDNNEPMCCIAEDDLEFSDLGAWNYFIKNIPEYFDLYLGSVYWSKEDTEKTNIVTDFSGFTLTIFHERFYDKFLSTNEQNNIDRQMKIHNGLYIICNPYIVKQTDGYSDHSKKVTNYNEIYLKGKKFYKSKQIEQKTLLS